MDSDIDFNKLARESLGISDKDTAVNRVLESRVSNVANTIATAYWRGKHDSEQRMRDFLDGKIHGMLTG